MYIFIGLFKLFLCNILSFFLIAAYIDKNLTRNSAEKMQSKLIVLPIFPRLTTKNVDKNSLLTKNLSYGIISRKKSYDKDGQHRRCARYREFRIS